MSHFKINWSNLITRLCKQLLCLLAKGCAFFYISILREKNLIKKNCFKHKPKVFSRLRVNVNYFYLLIPAFSDLCTSTLQYIALNYISPSIYQMLRGGVIVVTAIFSVAFLKKKLTLTQIVGCSLTIIGIAIVGLSNLVFPSKSNDSGTSSTQQLVAMLLIILSLFTNGILFVSEEKLFSMYYLHPFQVVGAEGCWGLLLYLLLLPLLTFIQCPSALNGSCVEYDKNFFFERPDAYFYEIFHNGIKCTLLFLVFLGIFTIAVFNIAGVSVTKYISSIARSVVDVTRTVLIWGVGLIVSFTVSDSNWENTRWQAILLELLGFVLLVSGNMIYNNIIKLSFLQDQSKIQNSDVQVSMEEKEED